MQTALTGISAAETLAGDVANNLANSQTAGFKASGGGFTQGTIAVSASPTDLALQGDGFFVLEGPGGERLYTRDGQFSVNAANELVSAGGERVLGFASDSNFQPQTGELSPLIIPENRTAADADGQAVTMTDFSIGDDGQVRGRFSDGTSRALGQIRLARFANPSGLEARGNNQYATGVSSGLPIESNPGDSGAATLTPGATELSNTDIGGNLVDLATASVAFRANLHTIATADEMFESLLNLGRR